MKHLAFPANTFFAFLSMFVLCVIAAGCSGSPASVTTAEPAAVTPTLLSQATPVSATPARNKVPFSSVAKGFRLGTPLPAPALLFIAENPDLDRIDALVDQEDGLMARTINFEKQALLAAFWGAKPSGGYSITIDQMFIAGDELVVEVLLQENDPEFPKIEAETSPYHLVSVDKTFLPDNLRQYRMLSGAETLASGALP